ncbi:tyrosine-type recombinase/integrase [Allosediminivita pacifica]|uniref:Phage integrase family protein n=1 Tax=Allosediminivita pacifica TaxID=1267769 RepID=A0A2T6B7D0_9RHOB|nr:site-specific integrase [Allosediminivita pacifica]PTX51964.1 phage integrase family protein [Allosediminivita pacifica]
MTVERALVELFEKKKASLKDNGSAGRWWSPVANHILPAIGKVGVADLTVQMIVDKLGKVYVEKPDTGDKVFFRLKSALEYASAQDDRVRPDVVDRAKVQLPRRRASKYRQDEGHHPALDYRDAPRLWGSLDLGDVVDAALAFYLLTLPRVANVAHMRWPQVDFRKAVWTIPPENMKTGVAFDAPLVPPALRILRGAKRFAFKGSDDLVFPNPRGRKTRIHHVNFLNNRLKQGGWQSTSQDKLAVAHGLRSTFSSYVVSETSHGARLAEMSIQHEVRTKQERAYNRADLLDKRREVLGDWAEFVLSLSARRAATASRLRSVAEPHGDRTMLDVERWLRPPAEDRWE